MHALIDQGFKETDIETAVERDLSGIITEGKVDRRTIGQRSRSERLRRVAIEQFKKAHDDKVFCEVCNFDFSEVYGMHGLGFIEVHHKEPIHEMDLAGTKSQLQHALEQVVLLCSNCHRMVHREKGKMLSISDLKAIIQKAS
jgi:predicted HNH restriction endonuclease